MELLINRTNIIYLEGQSDWTVEASWKLNGEDKGSLTVAFDNDKQAWFTTLPYFVEESEVIVDWKFQTADLGEFTKSEPFELVTPILSRLEIQSIHPNATDYELVRIEKAVRHIINAYTGQTFGKYNGTRSVRGANTIALQLPQRLISLNTVNGRSADPYFEIIAGGYALRHYPYGVPPVKADYDGLHMHQDGVIHNPNNVKMSEFNKAMIYNVNGIWGWMSVPEQVKEAAKLLVNDYACADANYRDRYLTSMTAADWRIQFNSSAFLHTGNVRADQLLNDFILKRGWAVL